MTAPRPEHRPPGTPVVWGRYEFGEGGHTVAAGTSDWTHHHSLALIRPDAVHRGDAARIIERLQEAGFGLRVAKLVDPTPRDLEELYRFTQTKLVLAQRRPYWWLMERYYTLGPALACVVGHRESGAAERLDALKGPSNPRLGRPGELRHDFGSINMCMCVVHTSATSDEVEREASIFFTPDKLRSLVADIAPPDLGPLPGAASATRGFHELALDLIAALGRLVGVDGVGPTVLPARRTSTGAELADAFEAELARVADIIGACAPLSPADAREPAGNAAAHYCLAGLLDWRSFAAADPVALGDLLQQIGIPLTRWDRLVLETTMPTYTMLRTGFVPSDLEPVGSAAT